MDLDDLAGLFMERKATGDWEGLITQLVEMRAFKREFDTLLRDVELAAAEAMPKRFVDTPQFSAERRNSTDRRNWQHHDLARMLVKHREDDIAHPQDVVDVLLQAAGVSYWRVTELRKAGLDPDEWCETSTRPTVQVMTKDDGDLRETEQ